MFQRFHAMKEQREGGFTLIELLVVILIIAILAAIAIPVFLNQRKKGWVSQMESAVKNAATAAESYATSNDGAYTGLDESALTTEGWRKASTVTVPAGGITVAADAYCVSVVHANFANAAGKSMSISSQVTAPTKTSTVCAAAGLMGTQTDWTP